MTDESPQVLSYRGVVYPWHCDQMGHMNVMWYTGKFDEATWNLFAELGLTQAYLAANGRGMAAVEQTTRYLRELVAGDTVTITSRLVEVREKVLRFEHAMVRTTDGTLAATSAITGVHLDTALRKACAFEEDIRRRAAAMVGSHTADPA